MADEWDDVMNRARDVKTRHEVELLATPGVKGVGIGFREKRGAITEEVCIVITVEKKYAAEDLSDDDALPQELEGFPVDIQEVGQISID